jgi:hypothetical protein
MLVMTVALMIVSPAVALEYKCYLAGLPENMILLDFGAGTWALGKASGKLTTRYPEVSVGGDKAAIRITLADGLAVPGTEDHSPRIIMGATSMRSGKKEISGLLTACYMVGKG